MYSLIIKLNFEIKGQQRQQRQQGIDDTQFRCCLFRLFVPAVSKKATPFNYY